MLTSAAPLLRLAVLSGPLAGRVIPWDHSEEEFVLGRDSLSHLELPDLHASRRHYRLIRTGKGEIAIEDLGSANGTFVRARRVSGLLPIAPGDTFAAGESTFRLEAVLPAAGERVSAVFDDDTSAPCLTETVKLPLHDLQDGCGRTALAASPAGLQSLIEAAGRVADALSTAELAQTVCDSCLSVLPGDRAALVVVAGAGTMMWAWRRSGPAGTLPVSQSVWNQVRASKAGLLCHDVRHNRDLAPSGSLAAQGVTALLAVPLIARGTTVGMLYVDQKESTLRFNETHLHWAGALARITALAVDALNYREQLQRENQQLRCDVRATTGIVGDSPGMRETYSRIIHAARSGSTVLLLGETGTGKELAARALHFASARATGPMIAVNCATLSESMLASELFGHEKGSFTGAIAQRKGKFELAHRGTLFLDEVGELALDLQAGLLRVLQEFTIERVGGSRPIPVDVRLVAATNRDLPGMIQAGRFRDDLFHRLNVIPIRIPPLRERREDIGPLVEHFMQQCAARAGRRVTGISGEAMALLNAYSWPGNVRQLENAIERAIALGDDDYILPEDLPEEIKEYTVEPLPGTGGRYHDSVREAKRRTVLEAFETSECNYPETARLLGMLPNNLHRLVTKLELRNELRRIAQLKSSAVSAPVL